MNRKEILLLRLRIEMLSKNEFKELKSELINTLMNEAENSDAAPVPQDITDEHVNDLTNRLLIAKYGETAVYDYLRSRYHHHYLL